MDKGIEFDVVAHDKASKTFDGISDSVDKMADSTAKANDKMDKAGSTTANTGSKFAAFLGVAGKAIAVMKEVADVVVNLTKKSSDYLETLNLLEVSFHGNTKAIRDFTKATSETLNLDEATLVKAAAHFRTLADSMNLSAEAGTNFSQLLSQLTLDLSSLYNVDFNKMQSALQYAVEGQGKTLKAITGASVTESSVQTQLEAVGVDAYVKDMSDADKAVARLIAITYQLQSAQGDLARTIESPANQFRVLSEQVTLLARNIGNMLLPVMSMILPVINGILIAINRLLSSLAALFGFQEANFDYVDEIAKSYDDLGASVGGVGDAAESTAKKMKGLRGFDKLNVINTPQAPSGGGGGAGGGGAGVNPALLKKLQEMLTGYNSGLDGLETKATKIANMITDAFMKVGDAIQRVWNSEPVQAYVNFLQTEFNFISDLVTTLGNDLYNNLVGTWENIESNVKTAIDNYSILITNYFNDTAASIETYGQPIIDNISALFNRIWTDAIDPTLQLMTQYWTDFSGILVELWNEYGAPISDEIGKAITKMTEWWQKLYDNILHPIIEPFMAELKNLWENHLKGMIEEVGKFIGELIEDALKIYNNFIQPIMVWITDKLAPVWAFLSSWITGILGTIVGAVADRIKSMIETFKGIVQFITGVFTGDWKKAWEGIKSIFKGVVDGLVGIFKVPLNLIIDGINAFIRGLNKLKIPDWVPGVGGKSFNINTIPKLAEGGLPQVGQMFIANEKGPELVGQVGGQSFVANQNQLMDLLSEKIGDSGGVKNATFVVQVGNEQIGKVVLQDLNRMAKNSGKVIEIGV